MATDTSTTLMIVLVASAVILIAVALTWAWRNKRTEKQRVEASEIRDSAAKESRAVGQREALADESEAKGRAARAESEAMAAHATGLERRAQTRHNAAVTDRKAVTKEYARADTVDPDVDGRDTTHAESASKGVPPRMPRAG